jgi:hypothetical protein
MMVAHPLHGVGGRADEDRTQVAAVGRTGQPLVTRGDRCVQGQAQQKQTKMIIYFPFARAHVTTRLRPELMSEVMWDKKKKKKMRSGPCWYLSHY